MHKEVLKLSVPNILSNISVPLISTVDTALMGHLSAAHLGAVGIGAMIFNFIYWNFGFLRMGVTGMTAQAYGAQENKEQIHLFVRGSLLALFIAFLLLLLMVPVEHISIWTMNVQVDQAPLISQYFKIRILAAPATLMIYVMIGWFLGMQNAIFPLMITLVVNLANAALSIYLVKYLDWSIAGVAWGTVIAQYIGLLFGLGLFAYRYQPLLKYMVMNSVAKGKALKKFLSINTDIFLRTVCLTLAFGFFFSQSSAAGAQILAINVILLQLLNWMSYGIDGFAFSAESMVGKYIGANDQRKTRKSIKIAFQWGFGLAVFYSIIYGLFYEDIISLFTNDSSLMQASFQYRWWMVMFPIAAFACYIWDGIFIGLTAVKAMRNTMLLALICYLLCYYCLKPFVPEQAIWLALMIFLFVRGIFQSLYFKLFLTQKIFKSS